MDLDEATPLGAATTATATAAATAAATTTATAHRSVEEEAAQQAASDAATAVLCAVVNEVMQCAGTVLSRALDVTNAHAAASIKATEQLKQRDFDRMELSSSPTQRTHSNAKSTAKAAPIFRVTEGTALPLPQQQQQQQQQLKGSGKTSSSSSKSGIDSGSGMSMPAVPMLKRAVTLPAPKHRNAAAATHNADDVSSSSSIPTTSSALSPAVPSTDTVLRVLQHSIVNSVLPFTCTALTAIFRHTSLDPASRFAHSANFSSSGANGVDSNADADGHDDSGEEKEEVRDDDAEETKQGDDDSGSDNNHSNDGIVQQLITDAMCQRCCSLVRVISQIEHNNDHYNHSNSGGPTKKNTRAHASHTGSSSRYTTDQQQQGDWLGRLRRSVVGMGGAMAAALAAGPACDFAIESQSAPWLDSPLLAGGQEYVYRAKLFSQPGSLAQHMPSQRRNKPEAHSAGHVFLRALAGLDSNKNAGMIGMDAMGVGEGSGSDTTTTTDIPAAVERFAKFMKRRVPADQGAIETVNRAMRATAAALIHHNGLTAEALALAMGTRVASPSQALLRSWKAAQKMRQYFRHADLMQAAMRQTAEHNVQVQVQPRRASSVPVPNAETDVSGSGSGADNGIIAGAMPAPPTLIRGPSLYEGAEGQVMRAAADAIVDKVLFDFFVYCCVLDWPVGLICFVLFLCV